MANGPDQFLKATSIRSEEKIGTPQFWHTASFGQSWLKDTYLESKVDGLDHRRKEVICAVCFLETFLFEWVRDDILEKDYKALATFFPPGRTMGISGKCNLVFKDLLKDNKIKEIPNRGTAIWANFKRLVAIRDALIHAAVSRPFQDGDSATEEKTPEISNFIGLQAGWALNVVTTLAAEFYRAAQMDVAPWILDPKSIS